MAKRPDRPNSGSRTVREAAPPRDGEVARVSRQPHSVVETRVFRSGNSDAVRIPKGFGLSGKTVRVRRVAGDRILIEPTTKRRWPSGFLASFGRMTPDFAPEYLTPLSSDEEARDATRFDHDDS